MNKKNIYLLLFIYAILNTYSQTVNVYLSPDINDEDSYPEIIGMNDQSFYVISSKSENEFYIENFTNKELRRIYKRQVEMPKIEGKPNTFENILYFNSHIYLFSSQHDKKLKKYTVSSLTSKLVPRAATNEKDPARMLVQDAISQIFQSDKSIKDRTQISIKDFELKDEEVTLKVKGTGFYTKLDLGIVKYHFENASGHKVR